MINQIFLLLTDTWRNLLVEWFWISHLRIPWETTKTLSISHESLGSACKSKLLSEQRSLGKHVPHWDSSLTNELCSSKVNVCELSYRTTTEKTLLTDSKRYSFRNITQNCTYTDTHPLNTVRNSKFLSKSHTDRAPLCFTGRCAPGPLASRLDAPVKRRIFQEEAAAKSDQSSLQGGKQVWSTFYYLSNTAHLWTTTHKPQWPCHADSHPTVKPTAFPQASSHPCITVRSTTNKLLLMRTQTERRHRLSEEMKRTGEGQRWCRFKEQNSRVYLNHFPHHDILYDCESVSSGVCHNHLAPTYKSIKLVVWNIHAEPEDSWEACTLFSSCLCGVSPITVVGMSHREYFKSLWE